jgi:hypothetical protein
MICENRERNENGEQVWCFSMPLKAVMAVVFATVRIRREWGVKGWDVLPVHDPVSDCQPFGSSATCALTYIQAATDSCEVVS